jgi:hypothetical protein
VVEVVEAVVEVAVVAEEVVEEDQYHHPDRPNLLDSMSLHHEEKLKPWDSSHASSPEIEAKLTTSSTSSVVIFD